MDFFVGCASDFGGGGFHCFERHCGASLHRSPPFLRTDEEEVMLDRQMRRKKKKLRFIE